MLNDQLEKMNTRLERIERDVNELKKEKEDGRTLMENLKLIMAVMAIGVGCLLVYNIYRLMCQRQQSNPVSSDQVSSENSSNAQTQSTTSQHRVIQVQPHSPSALPPSALPPSVIE